MNNVRLQLEPVTLLSGDSQLYVGVSMQLASGDCVQVVGASGSGKTSLLRIIAGLLISGFRSAYILKLLSCMLTSPSRLLRIRMIV